MHGIILDFAPKESTSDGMICCPRLTAENPGSVLRYKGRGIRTFLKVLIALCFNLRDSLGHTIRPILRRHSKTFDRGTEFPTPRTGADRRQDT